MMKKYYRSVGDMCPLVEVTGAKNMKKIMTGCGKEVKDLAAFCMEINSTMLCPHCKRKVFLYMLSDTF